MVYFEGKIGWVRYESESWTRRARLVVLADSINSDLSGQD